MFQSKIIKVLLPLPARINILHRCTTSLPFTHFNEKSGIKMSRGSKINKLRDISASELFISRLNEQFSYSHDEIRTAEIETEHGELEKQPVFSHEQDNKASFEVGRLYNDQLIKQNLARVVEAGNKVDRFLKTVTRHSVREAAERYVHGSTAEMVNFATFARLHADRGADFREKATYRELVAMDNFRRDALKTASAFVLPFFSAGISCMLLPPMRQICPRKMLARSYWSPKQVSTYYAQNHLERLLELCEVMRELEGSKNSSGFVRRAVGILLDNRVASNSELLQMKSCFRENPILLDNVQMPVLRSLCKIFEVNSIGTTKALKRRLHNKASDLMAMDRKLVAMEMPLLSNDDVTHACYMRCVNSVALSREANEYWLRNWLLLSNECGRKDTNFYLYCIVVQGMSYGEKSFCEKKFG